MKNFMFFLCIIVVSACQPLPVNDLTVTPNNRTNLATLPITKTSNARTPTIINTYTAFPSNTAVPTETLTPLPPQFFKPANIKTFTPASPAKCPTGNLNLAFDFNKAWDTSGAGEPNQQFTEYILNFLNSGGTMQSILPAFNKYYDGRHVDPFFYIKDVTGDGIPELIFPYGVWMDIFGCKDGKFQLMSAATYESDLNGVSINAITDINRDGLAEIVVYFSGCMGDRCPSIRVYEWDGEEFRDLINNPSSSDGCSSLSIAPFDVEVRDIDHNGTKEIILHTDGKSFPDGIEGFPYRGETRICMWNGQNVVLYENEFDPPHYRYQAVQDGDRAASAGQYNKAMSLYQQTIFDKNLEWFSQEKNLYEFWVYHANYFSSEPTPTVSPSMIPNPNEYSNLAAYARYRIMLLAALQNNLSGAQVAYNAIQKEYPPDGPGGYFTQMASAFWQKYQTSQNIEQACGAAIAIATTNPDTLKYLGDWDHGIQSIVYTPDSVCTFK